MSKIHDKVAKNRTVTEAIINALASCKEYNVEKIYDQAIRIEVYLEKAGLQITWRAGLKPDSDLPIESFTDYMDRVLGVDEESKSQLVHM